LSSAIKIYLIILVIYLEPVLYGDDFFNRLKNNYFPPVEKADFNDEWRNFRIETLTDRRFRRYGRDKKIIEYLVK
jgi:hypothetical protein